GEALEEAREEAAAARSEAVTERDRLRELRPRFIRRLKRQWTTERKDAERRATEVARLRRGVEDDSARLAKERATLQRDREQTAQQRQQLRDESQALAEAHAQFAEERRTAVADKDRRERQVTAATHAAYQSRQQAETQRAELEKRCDELRREARGLEQRVSNARRVLADATTPIAKPAIEVAMVDPTPIATLLANLPESDRARVADYYQRCQDIVQAQAAQLADQRAHLTELYEGLTC